MGRGSTPELAEDLAHLLIQARDELLLERLKPSTLDRALAELDRLPASAAGVGASLTYPVSASYRRILQSRWRLFARQSISGRVRIPDLPGAANLFLFHRDGFVREEALSRLDGSLRSPFFFAAVAYRLNDWVPQVRQAARACAERSFALTEPGIVAEAATALLPRRRAWRRWDGEAAQVLDAAFTRPDVIGVLARLMREAPTGPLASVLRALLPGPAVDEHLLDLAAHALQPSVRAVAMQTLIEGKANWPEGFSREWIDKVYGISRRVTVYGEREVRAEASREHLIEQAARDKSAAVRRIAAAALIKFEKALPGLDRLMALLADDRSPAVRERVAFLAQRRHRQ